MFKISDLFSSAKPATPPAGVANVDPMAKAPEKTPTVTAVESKEPKSPLDEYKEFWQPAKDGAGGPTPVDFKADPAKLMEAALKIDFAKAVTPEMFATVQKGGDDATKALVQMLQATSATVYAQSAFAATKIAETAVAQAQSNFEKQLPAILRKQGLQDKLVEDNPALAHPAIQPMIEAMQTQFSSKYPNATPTELLEMARSYVAAAGTAFAPAPKGAAKTTKKLDGYDWSKFLDS